MAVSRADTFLLVLVVFIVLGTACPESRTTNTTRTSRY
jgi:hypothetical protein